MKMPDDLWTKTYPDLTKTVRVSDPTNWYGQHTVEVKLHVTVEFHGQRDVSILVKSIDDFMMIHTKPCFNGHQLKALYESAKRYMYDTMPKTINVSWLYEHGYDKF